MERHVIELYSADDIPRLKKKERRYTAAAVIFGVLTLAVCVLFCILSRTYDQKRMLLYTICSSTIGGWVVISLAHFAVAEVRRAIAHTKAVLEGERNAVDGKFTLTNERLLVKRGVSMVRVDVAGAPRVASLQLYDKKKALFNAAKAVRAYSVHGFIAAYEEGEEDARN